MIDVAATMLRVALALLVSPAVWVPAVVVLAYAWARSRRARLERGGHRS